MAFFNVLKGAYPTLQQIDLTLPVAAGQSGIVRGSLVYQDGTEFKLAGAAQATVAAVYLHFCLMAQTDLTAGMAGSRGQGSASGQAVITGLAPAMPLQFETDQFNTAITYTVGMLLTVGASGKLTQHTTGDHCVAQVTAVVTSRWVNNAVAVTGFRTGANVSVLRARTLWHPLLAT